MSVIEYVARFDDLYRDSSEICPTEAMKISKFKQGLNVGVRAWIYLQTFPTYKEWVDAARNTELIIQELRDDSQQRRGVKRQRGSAYAGESGSLSKKDSG